MIDGGLFSLEACPPGTTTMAVLWLCDDENSADAAVDFLQTLVAMLSGGITLGGKAARGIGLAQLNGSPVYRVYDLASVQDHAAWFDDRRAWQLAAKPFPVGKHLQPVPGADSAMLEVRFTLGIPRGQDILVGDGKGLEHEIEPQRIEAAHRTAVLAIAWRIAPRAFSQLGCPIRSARRQNCCGRRGPVSTAGGKGQKRSAAKKKTEVLNGDNSVGASCQRSSGGKGSRGRSVRWPTSSEACSRPAGSTFPTPMLLVR